MPVVVRDFEVVQETTPPAAAAQPQAVQPVGELDAEALERELAVLRARELRVRAY